MEDFRTTVDAYKVAMREINDENSAVHVTKLLKKKTIKWQYAKTCFWLGVTCIVPFGILLAVPLFIIVTVAMLVNYSTFAEKLPKPIIPESGFDEEVSKDGLAKEKTVETKSAAVAAPKGYNKSHEAGRKFAKFLFRIKSVPTEPLV